MKKIFTTLIISLLFLITISGCKNNDNTTASIVSNLDSNLSKLGSVVNKLDVVDNMSISNPDIYSSTLSIKNEKINNYKLSSKEIGNHNTINNISEDLFNKIIEGQKGSPCNNCDTNIIECEKYCDSTGNCYYKDCQNNCYIYKVDGVCDVCDNIPDTCSHIGKSYLYEDGKEMVVENNSLNSENLSATNNSCDGTTLNSPNPRFMFYFSQDSFSPIKLRYNPRYVNEYSEETINEQIENYLFKVQRLYAMTEDTIEANIILQECKKDVLDCIDEIRQLNNCIINGECEPNIQELQAIKSYIQDIKTTTQRLKNCNGELRKELTNISEENSANLVNSVDVMNSNYLRLINHLDTRITYHKSAIATLDQIKYLLDNVTAGDQIPEEDLENIIESLSVGNENEENLLDASTNKSNNEDLNVNNKLDTNNESNQLNNVEDIVTNIESDSNEVLAEDNNNNEDVVSEENIDAISNNNSITDGTVYETTQEITDVEENINPDEASQYDTSDINTDTITENLNDEQSAAIIDSYKNNSWSNIDTYKNNNSDSNNTNNDDTIHNETSNTDSTIVDDTSQISTDIDNNQINNSSDINNQNSIVAPNTSILNDNLYNNSVITQNNLNNDDGYGGYYYTAEGEIKNNGVNNNNEIGNNGNTIETNMNKNNNVNTYGYNTILDIINQGTVNNGINTL